MPSLRCGDPCRCSYHSKKAKDGIKYGKVVLNAKRTFSYDAASVRVFGGRTATDINAQWDTIFKIYEIEKCFIIYFRYNLAFCLPKISLHRRKRWM